MNSNANQSPMTLVGTARTTKAIDDKHRDKLYLKLTSEQAGQLVQALNGLEGKDVVIDIRTGKQVAKATGQEFPTSFIMIREAQAAGSNFAGNGGGAKNYSKGTFKPKGSVAGSSAAVSQAKRIAEES